MIKMEDARLLELRLIDEYNTICFMLWKNTSEAQVSALLCAQGHIRSNIMKLRYARYDD